LSTIRNVLKAFVLQYYMNAIEFIKRQSKAWFSEKKPIIDFCCCMSVSSQAVVGCIRKSEVQCQYSSSNSGYGRWFFSSSCW